jgi:hypothetical protein
MPGKSSVTLEDFGRQDNEEVIRLSRKREIGTWWDGRIERDWIDYTDTPETNAMREAMRRINAWLEQAAITFEGDGGRSPRQGPSTALCDP